MGYYKSVSMNSANIIAWVGVLALLVVMTTSAVPNGNDVINCIQGRLQCYDNLTCADLYDDMEYYCDTSITTCDAMRGRQCQRVLLKIQTYSYFRTCTCDVTAHDADECITIQSRIFMHRCIDQPDCFKELDPQIPIFMYTTVIRRYNNQSDCSEICQCQVDGTLMCKKLPCGPNLHCDTKTGQVYHHGSSYSDRDRGQCHCSRGEMVCARSPSNMMLKPGLYFHVGYSLSDQYLLENNSVVRFNPRQVADKFGTLLNGDSAEQICSLSLYRQVEANLVFEIQVSDNSPIANKEESCVTPAKMLSDKVNSRDPVIVTDAELSIVKVAQLERVRFFKVQSNATQQPPMGEYNSTTFRVTASLKNMAAGLVLFCICCQL